MITGNADDDYPNNLFTNVVNYWQYLLGHSIVPLTILQKQ